MNNLNQQECNLEAYNLFSNLYNKFANKLEELGADDQLFLDLMELCASSSNVYR